MPRAVIAVSTALACAVHAVHATPACDACARPKEEYCTLFPHAQLCGTECGFVWDAAAGRCRAVAATADAPITITASTAPPIIGGQGKYRYQYMPDRLKPPAGAGLVNCHGLSVDVHENIILTYENDGVDPHCIIAWDADGTNPRFAGADSHKLCDGTPHGLKITTEADGKQHLYHANNDKKLAKTTLDGAIEWMVEGFFPGQNQSLDYKPTWFATPADSKYIYLCDGYGSNRVYVFDGVTGAYLNKSWGGRSPGGGAPGPAGPTQPHGLFWENHGCTWDPRDTSAPHTIVVSDRRNMRFELFHYDPAAPTTFEWYDTVDLRAQMGPDTLPCNIRMTHGSKYDPSRDGEAIMADLNGPVAVLDHTNTVVSVVNVSVLLAAEEHKHPHDALFLANGDFVVATWAPGRLSYWKRLPLEE